MLLSKQPKQSSARKVDASLLADDLIKFNQHLELGSQGYQGSQKPSASFGPGILTPCGSCHPKFVDFTIQSVDSIVEIGISPERAWMFHDVPTRDVGRYQN